MAANAVGDSDFPVERAYAQRVIEVAGSKCEAVIPAVDPFCQIFTKDPLGSVAAVAGGHLFMGRVIPGVKLVPHNMAVQASFGVIKEIGGASGVDKCKYR